LEVIVITRRIVISACALCLAIPAAAGASPAKGPYGATAPDPPKVVEAKGPYGVTTPDPPKLVEAKGPYGVTTPDPPKLVKAEGPYGTTLAPSSEATTTGATTLGAAASSHDGINDWRTAAISEAALLAALALGLAALLAGRRRAPSLGT
jgi:hypothetical protein